MLQYELLKLLVTQTNIIRLTEEHGQREEGDCYQPAVCGVGHCAPLLTWQ